MSAFHPKLTLAGEPCVILMGTLASAPLRASNEGLARAGIEFQPCHEISAPAARPTLNRTGAGMAAKSRISASHGAKARRDTNNIICTPTSPAVSSHGRPCFGFLHASARASNKAHRLAASMLSGIRLRSGGATCKPGTKRIKSRENIGENKKNTVANM